MGAALDLKDRVFERLLVLKRLDYKRDSNVLWECRCECGSVIVARAASLKSGNTLSCGCLQRDRASSQREKNPAWKGGRKIRTDGYATVLDRTHANADPQGYVLEHVHVMSAHVGRPMLKGETVHHKNGVRSDNRLENLELWSSRHPVGQRTTDKVAWAIETLKLYAPEYLADSGGQTSNISDGRSTTQPCRLHRNSQHPNSG